MIAVGFEPTQFALGDLESPPLDHSGKLPFIKIKIKKLSMPGIEPGSHAWKARILTIIPH
jgi:hypothetical protein